MNSVRIQPNFNQKLSFSCFLSRKEALSPPPRGQVLFVMPRKYTKIEILTDKVLCFSQLQKRESLTPASFTLFYFSLASVARSS
ncbi:MAG: hypothetical protein IJ325_04485, partial [Clostridia bacterium]|nr:hypothetical protein [Clostridia bacterium]